MTKAKLKSNGLIPIPGDLVQLGTGYATWRVVSVVAGYAWLSNITNFRERHGVPLDRLIVTYRNGRAV